VDLKLNMVSLGNFQQSSLNDRKYYSFRETKIRRDSFFLSRGRKRERETEIVSTNIFKVSEIERHKHILLILF